MNKIFLLFLIGAGSAMADSSREQTIYNTYNNHLSETTVNQYDDCKGAALSSAIGNTQMYLGTRKPQLSVGMGSCGGEYAGSLMFGARPCDSCALVNGSFSTNGDVNTLGIGATFLFK
jgi:hypothetical protein